MVGGVDILNQSYFFEPLGGWFVYRPNIFSRGYSVSRTEKDQLFAGLKRLHKRFLIEGLVAIAAVGAVFLSGAVTSPTPIPWFVIISVVAVLLIAPTAIIRERRLVGTVLGGRPPDVPRLALREALTRPRPMIAKRYALPVLRSIVVLFILMIIIMDVFALVPVVAAFLPELFPGQAVYDEKLHEALAQTFHSPVYWAVVAALNLLLLLCIRLLKRELARLRALPDLNDAGGGS